MNAAATGRFSSTSRVRKRSEFLRIQADASRVVTPHLVFLLRLRSPDASACALDQKADCPRLGVTVPKRIGAAPYRSRAKRLIREAFRRMRPGLARDLDVVVIVRNPLGEMKLATLLEEWQRATRQILRRVDEARAAAVREPPSAPG